MPAIFALGSLGTSVGDMWHSFKKGMREALDEENNGSLRPVIDLLSGPQIEGCLLAVLPQLLQINSGNLAVDIFVVSSAVTFIMAVLGLAGSIIRKIIDVQPITFNERNLSIKVEFHRMDEYNEAQENIHWQALAWFFTKCSNHQTQGDFRMIPYISENEDNSTYTDDTEREHFIFSIPAFNILPISDRELEIVHNNAKYTVQFVTNNSKDSNKQSSGEWKETRPTDPMINREPPILIRRYDTETSTLEEMRNMLHEITTLFVKNLSAKKQRARYERPVGFSCWRWVQNLRSTRGLSCVALDHTQETLLMNDLQTFVDDRDFYKRMGLPYRRGYLFSGKPGTGKTSLINAISATYNRDLYYINLQDIKSDNELQSAFASVPTNSIIVFEDIDAQSGEVHSRERRFALKKVDKFRALKEKELVLKKKKREAIEAKVLEESTSDESKQDESQSPKKTEMKLEDLVVDNDTVMDSESIFGPSLPSGLGIAGVSFGDLQLSKGSFFTGFTLSMLLNCLDGHMLNENIIIIMTTNHPEVLDPALVRPGRIDLHLSLGYCTKYQMNRMYQTVMNDTSAKLDFLHHPIPEYVIAPCDALRIMILYRSNPNFIPLRLLERARELLDGISDTFGIQAADLGYDHASAPFSTTDSIISMDSSIDTSEGSEITDEGVRLRKTCFNSKAD